MVSEAIKLYFRSLYKYLGDIQESEVQSDIIVYFQKNEILLVEKEFETQTKMFCSLKQCSFQNIFCVPIIYFSEYIY